MRYLSW